MLPSHSKEAFSSKVYKITEKKHFCEDVFGYNSNGFGRGEGGGSFHPDPIRDPYIKRHFIMVCPLIVCAGVLKLFSSFLLFFFLILEVKTVYNNYWFFRKLYVLCIAVQVCCKLVLFFFVKIISHRAAEFWWLYTMYLQEHREKQKLILMKSEKGSPKTLILTILKTSNNSCFLPLPSSIFRFHQNNKIWNSTLNHFQKLWFHSFPPPMNLIFLDLVLMPRILKADGIWFLTFNKFILRKLTNCLSWSSF